MFVRDARSADDVVRLASTVSDPGFGLVRCRGTTWHDREVGRLATELARLGFVVVRSCRPPPAAVRRGRHLALLAVGEDWSQAVTWVRQAGLRSVRSHLLVVSGETRTAEVRERAPGYAAQAVRPAWSRAWRRARCCARQRRGESERRWLRAAAIEAQGRGEETSALLVARLLVRRLIAHGDWEAAWRVALDLARRADADVVADQAAGLASSLALHLGRLEEAEAIAGTAAVAAALRGQSAAGWVARRMGEVRLFQDRMEEAVAWLDAADRGSRDDLLRSAACWLAGAKPPAGAVRVAAPTAPDADALGVAALCADPALESGALAEFDAQLALAVRRRPRWVLASRAIPATAVEQSLRMAGYQRAPRAIRRALETHALSPVQAVVARVPGPVASRPRLVHGGVTRLIHRIAEDPMSHLTRELPVLLERVADAEDDVAALDVTCRWARRQAGVDGVALVGCSGEWVRHDGVVRAALTAEMLEGVAGLGGPRLVATDGAALALSPVRYAGAVIGAFVVHAGLPTAETARDAAGFGAAVCGPAMRARLDALAASRRTHERLPELVGDSPAMVAIREAVARAAATNFPVLVEGESGTGKELVARGVHRLSARRDHAFCPVNCAALTDELVEAELFGHARGAFTGAAGARAGLFEEAHRGTLFMDEVSELSPRAQAKVLRALQEGEIRRVGENAARRVDVRIVGATNRPLGAATAAGQFREDLLFRLAVARIRLPPLRERVEDLPELARRFWARAAVETNTRARLGPDALARLVAHRWPGNVRELQNTMAALVLAAPPRGRVGATLVSRVLEGANDPTRLATRLPLRQARRAAERRHVVEALARHGGRRSAAARELGLSRQGLAKAVRRLGLGPSRRRAGVA